MIRLASDSFIRIFFLLAVLSINFLVYSQSTFNNVIFKKQFNFAADNFSVHHNPVQSLGDINNDGYDDILIYDCSEELSSIYYGGNPVDTVADLIIDGAWNSFNRIDLNDDGYEDFVFTTKTPYMNNFVKVYYGGVQLDTTVDLIFNAPLGTYLQRGIVLKDFNGDGRSELVLFSYYAPSSTTFQYGATYFYNTESVFDTIPHYQILGDSASKSYVGPILSSGDLNGDHLTDFTYYVGIDDVPGSRLYYRKFIIGSPDWSFTQSVTYYENEHSFDPIPMHILGDINKDGKSDIIMYDYGFYPYYYQNIILKGNFPIDTIPSWGLNCQNTGIMTTETINLGDVNGDHFNDFMSRTATFPINLKLWLGGRNIHPVADKTWYGTDPGGFCSGYAAAGDINGDGVNDIAILEKPYYPITDCEAGRIYIFSGDTTAKADTIVVVTDAQEITPTGYMLNAPYPNPFNPLTVISWSAPANERVVLKIFDILGREIAVLTDREKNIGENRLEFNADKYKLASGIYLLQMECYDKGKLTYKSTKKLSFIK